MKFTTVDRTDERSVRIRERIILNCTEMGWIYDEEKPDLVICIGGDGTFLRAIHQYIDRADVIQFVGIHTGTLGFLTDYTCDELERFFFDLKQNEPRIEKSPFLKIRLEYKNGEQKTLYSFNEIRIESSIRTLNLDVFIDNEYFEHTTGSGICISTQAGSTAVTRALQGAVIDSGLDVLQLCEIMPISHSNHHTLRNPYIMKSDREVRVECSDLSKAFLYYDYLQEDLENVNVIHVSTSTKKVRFARYRTYSYLKRLKNLY